MRNYLNITQYNMIQTKAECLIYLYQRKVGANVRPPIQAELIARTFGFKIEHRKLNDWGRHTMGALSVDDGTIYFDDRSTWCQREFTIAHELAHWFLHDDSSCVLQMDTSENIRKILDWSLDSTRENNKDKKKKLLEIEANRFAAALLIPQRLLIDASNSFSKIGSQAIRELAKQFNVSSQTMFYRIKDLSKYLAWESGTHIDWGDLDEFENCYKKGKAKPDNNAIDKSIKSLSALIDSPMIEPAREQAVFKKNSDEYNNRLYPKREGKAKVIADFLRKQLRSRNTNEERKKPLIVEFSGTPNAGKDTLIGIINDYIEDGHGYRVRVIDEGVKQCHIHGDVEKMLKTVAMAVLQLYEAKLENPGNYDIVIFNRGLFDRLAFLHALNNKGLISSSKKDVHLEYLLSYTNLIDIVFLLLISPEESLERERVQKRTIVKKLFEENFGVNNGKYLGEQNFHNIDTLEELNLSFLHAYSMYKERFNNRIFLMDLIEGDNIDVLDKVRAIASITLPGHSLQLPLPELFDLYYKDEVLSQPEKSNLEVL